MLIDIANYVTFSFLLSGYSGVYILESAVACASLRVPYKIARLPVLVHLPARCVLWFGHTAESKWAGLRNHCIRLADLPYCWSPLYFAFQPSNSPRGLLISAGDFICGT